MAEFLKAFIPTVAFMLVPLLIPVVAIAVGSVSDRLRRDGGTDRVSDRARANAAQRDAVSRDFAQAA